MSSLIYSIPLFVISLIAIFIIKIKSKRAINVDFSITTARTENEKERLAKTGLIIFVSLYKPFKSPIAEKLSLQNREKAAFEKDYQLLDLENSNLQPVIEAICSHKFALKHCWLIGTTNTEKVKGSVMYQDVLIEFLKKEKGINCDFYYGQKYAIPFEDDALICSKTYKMMQEIFKEGSSFGLESKDLIADCTGGNRSMVAGMILSCLHEDNDIQLIGTQYDAFSNPEGPLFPVYISFKPEIKVQG